MDIKTYLPLLGVVLGWLLSEIAHVFRLRRDEKRIIGKAILKLVELRSIVAEQLSNVLTTKTFIDSGDLSNDEKLFINNLRVEVEGVENLGNDLDKLLADVAAVDPFLSYKLEKDIRGIPELLKMGENFIVSARGRQPIQSLSYEIIETTCRFLLNDLKKFALKLSRRKSLWLWIRAWWFFRNEQLVMAETGSQLKQSVDRMKYVVSKSVPPKEV